MDYASIKQTATELITTNHIMTIATADGEIPWSAPVYYIYSDKSFFFFSKPDSQHIKNSENKLAAVSIHQNPTGWQDIKGIQMQGIIEHAGFGLSSGKAFKAYLKRFDFINEIKSIPGKRITGPEMMEATFKSRWYRFKPEIVHYLDNSIAFGKREIVNL